MPLSDDDAVKQVKKLKDTHENEREQLDLIRQYWKGRQGLLPVIPSATPNEVRRMAQIARVNVISIVIDALSQATFVDGFRAESDDENAEVWSAWQANRMDAKQTGLHRATYAYGAAYEVILPGKPEPVIRCVSPRHMTAMYGEDPDWPIWALEDAGNGLWKLYDDEAVYYVGENRETGTGKPENLVFIESREHPLDVTPVVRFLDEEDLDIDDDVEPQPRLNQPNVPMRGQVAPLMSLQDQIDLTTFGLLVAQHYTAFRQRWAIGWIAPDEKALIERMTEDVDADDTEEVRRQAAAAAQAARMKAGAEQLWTFDVHPEDMKVGEFGETSLEGYIKSREASLRHAATLSQTPVHELIGEVVNLSAEALAAAEKGHDRKVDERETVVGERHEQSFWLAGKAKGIEVPDDAQVVWRDTSARAFSATVDALGKMVSLLGIPPQELWERVPGATQQDVARWKTAAQTGDAFAQLAAMLDRQAGNGTQPAPAPVPAPPG